MNQNPTVTTNSGQVFGNQTSQVNQVNTINKTTDNTTLSANTLFGVNFLPNSILGWLLLLIIVLAIVWALRKLSQPTTYVVHK